MFEIAEGHYHHLQVEWHGGMQHLFIVLQNTCFHTDGDCLLQTSVHEESRDCQELGKYLFWI